MRIAVVANPTSGKGYGRVATALALHRLTASDATVLDISAPTAEAAREEAARAVASGVDALVVVGGDGMVHLGVNAVAGTGVPLGVVPAGTGNDNARAFGLTPREPVAAVDRLLEHLAVGRTRTVDLARATTSDGTSRWFVGVLSAGFDALVNERANGWRWPRGPVRYNLAIARELPVFRPMEYRLTLDDEVQDVRGMLVSVANGTSFGGGMQIAPDALLDDGLLDVVVLGPISTARFVRVFPTVYTGDHVKNPAVTVRRARRVRVELPGRAMTIYADGERVGPAPLDCEVVPGALRVLAAGTD
ncbi:diacylglycerol kinase [Angustibacter speluncae]